MAAVSLMLNPAFGPSAKKTSYKEKFVYKLLGERGITLYKTTFDKNNKKMVKAFMENNLIKNILWPKVIPHLTEQMCFSNEDAKPSQYRTLCAIT